MFGIGMPEMILILAIALIVLGPKRLPDLAKSLGRAMREFKKATSEFKESIEIDDELKDVKKSFDDINTDIKASIDLTRPLAADVKPAASQTDADGKSEPAPADAAPKDEPAADDAAPKAGTDANPARNSEPPEPEKAESDA